MILTRRLALLSAAILTLSASSAIAQTPPVAAKCDTCSASPPMPVVGACDQLINSKRVSGAALGDALRARGYAYIRNKNYAFAKQDYDQAIKLNPNDIAAYGLRGVTFATMKRYDEAIADYTLVIQKMPANHAAINMRGKAYLEKGLNKPALQDFEQAIKLQPNNSEYQMNKTRALLRNIKDNQDELKKHGVTPTPLPQKQ